MQATLALDHLVVAARSLEEGATYVEAVLGVELSPGGQHPHMGTHNRLLSLGTGSYLEVIAVDPDGLVPGWPRWFDLDRFDGAPRMTNWVCRTDDLHEALDAAPEGAGLPVELSRGDLSWAMGVPEDGRLPFEGAMPALIEWDAESAHPCDRLPDRDVRLTRLDVFHPQAARLLDAFPALRSLEGVALREGPEKRLIATIATPEGTRILA